MSKEEIEATESAAEETTPKKRTMDEATGEEIEIDLNQSAPLSKKQKRLLRKGKLDLAKLEKKNPKPKPANIEETESSEEKEKKPERIGVWIGNLSFDTTKDDLIRFITNKTTDLPEFSTDLKETEPCQINEKDFVRINLPMQHQSKKIKGFAYIDFPTKNHQSSVIQLSEQHLNGRNLLIKNSSSFEGRPSKEDAPLSKNPPSRILFVGNLSFDTTNELLTQHFQHCGDIIKIRMATFEDTGKCKGFAFLDFKDEEGPTKALKDKSCRKLMQRNLRLEYGEDRSKRTPKNLVRKPEQQQEESSSSSYNEPTNAAAVETFEKPAPVYRERQNKPKRTFNNSDRKPERPKSSVALAGAQRQSAAIVKSTGKKITF
ncbi:hypothetical protein WICANDRAFT_84894 [Wickerhamomyces anomalus NRRL Y-366-8]|uniref:RRM domain-containing protein n=1 Tax=Wickerhamomyces anomalus (strain ATCC 58044 / CBS 1984 / NCYC 433 / NRRL Y-366-8) TaxID=683960 RepID=A0A1E3P1S4_WICAA|nr:uncharacterized protein WICANDRAFT_84894 [Wickerhamomyces anomalus NRRL Y-366-8]ODQ59293.1 hypothetical protein WICANDRAFT_84894 [Wickerhamomyces anomalus NRRL Y-366-8]